MAPPAAAASIVFRPRDWKDTYSRNYRPDGRKNLRCFPQCRPEGHAETHWCGHSVDVELLSSSPSRASTLVVGDLQQTGAARWRVGELMSEASVHALVKSDAMVRAEPVGDALRFSSRGWNYPFRISRHALNTLHAFHVYVLEPARGGGARDLMVTAVATSPSFKIVTHRRAATTQLHHQQQQRQPQQLLSETSTVPSSGSPPTSPSLSSRAGGDDDDADILGDLFTLLDGDLSPPSAPAVPPASKPMAAPEDEAAVRDGARLFPALFRLVAVPEEESSRRKRSATPSLSYEGFLSRVPGEVDDFLAAAVDTLSLGPSASLAPPYTNSEQYMRKIGSIVELEELLPRGINLKLLMTPAAITVDDVFPDVAGRYKLPDFLLAADFEQVLADLNLPGMFSSFARFAVQQLYSAFGVHITLVNVAWDALEVRFPRALHDAPVRLVVDAVVRDYKLVGPVSMCAPMTLQCWVVGPVFVARVQVGEKRRVDRCCWRHGADKLAVLFVYQSLGGHGWSRGVFDRGLASVARFTGDWVVDKVTVFMLDEMPVEARE